MKSEAAGLVILFLIAYVTGFVHGYGHRKIGEWHDKVLKKFNAWCSARGGSSANK